MRYKILIEYDGTPYSGWQRQKEHPSIQAAIEKAIHSFSGEEVTVFGAGRTDAGVHALGQVAHFDMQKQMEDNKLVAAINYYLRSNEDKVSILEASTVADDFHARFSAVKRHYIYQIANRPAHCVLNQYRHWWFPKPLDIDLMRRAAEKLVGLHDFTTFRSSQCQALNPVRHLDQLDITVEGDIINFYLSARGFLHNQVRSLVGSLTEVGTKRWTVEDLENALAACDRQRCGRVAPAHGLFFAKVDY